jgi:hypothetical protein
MTTLDEKEHDWMGDADTDKERTYGIIGLYIYSPSERWTDAGVCAGDFLGSTSITQDVNSPEKIHEALAAPAGTELIVIREGKRVAITL